MELMKKLLFLLLFSTGLKAQFLINPYVFGGSISTTNLQLYWDASNTASYPGTGTTFSDLSGNGHDGTMVNGVTYNSGSGGYMNFDGTNDYITNTSYSVKGLSNCTIHVWKKHVGTFTGTTFSSGSSSVGVVYLEGWNYNFFANAGFRHVSSDSGNGFNSWKLFTFTYAPGSQKMYENGVLQTATESQPGALDTYSGTRTVLGAQANYSNPSAVDVGSLAIYNRTFVASEVLEFFNATKVRFGY